MKYTSIILIVAALCIVGTGAYYFIMTPSQKTTFQSETPSETTPPASDTLPVTETPTPSASKDTTQTTIGTSVNGNPIVAYHFGSGTKELLFVGGIHGGYEWNTVLVAFNLVDYLKQHPEIIPANEKVTIIPVLNPDGLNMVVGTTSRFTSSQVATAELTQIQGRYNANQVDLNRNFDCDWQSSGTWQRTRVSGGESVFSEPESKAVKQYVESHTPTAVVVWFSAAGGVYSSNCHTGVSSETKSITSIYANASGYPAHESFDFYAVTGDITNWLAKINIPAISVLLTDHKNLEWDNNLAGVKSLLTHYGE